MSSLYELTRASLFAFFGRYSRGGRKGGLWGVWDKVDVGSSFAEVKRWGVAQARYGTAVGHGGGGWGGWWVRSTSGVPPGQVAILGQGGHWKRQRRYGAGLMRASRGLCGGWGMWVAGGVHMDTQGGSGVVSWSTPPSHLKVARVSLLGILGSAGCRQNRGFSLWQNVCFA